jgi:hypothetical protein
MGNIIKYSTTGVTNTISKGNFYLGVNSNTGGPTDITGFWNGIQPPLSGYTLYGNKNDAFGPSINVFNNDAELISFVNQRGGNVSTISGAINYFSSNDELMLVNKDYESIVTDGLVLNLDASFTPSYPKSGNTWYDLSLSGNNGTLVNGPVYSSDGDGSMTFDGGDDYISTTITGTFQQITFEFYGFFDDPNFNMLLRDESAFGDWTNGRVHFGTRWNGSSAGMHFNVNGSWQTTPPTNLKYGWNHYVLVYDTINNLKRVYLNNILSSSYGTNGNMILGDFRVGVATFLDKYYRGKMSGFKIYNRPLSSSEITQNYQVMLSRFTGDNIVMNGIVLYLDAGYNGSYIGSGTTWNDISGYGNNGTLVNGVTYSTDYSGSIVFDGVDDYVNCGANSIFNSTDITISCFFKPTTISSFQTMVSKKSIVAGWELSNSTGVLRVTLRPSSGGSNEIRTGSLIINSWYYGVFTFNSSLNELKLYLNGVLVGSTITSTPTIISTSNLYVGTRNDGVNYNPFNGDISQTLIYNRALTSQEILQNYNATKSRYVLYKNAYEIKQANPNSPSGIYTISNPGINDGAPTQIYADMETDGGGWTLIMTNSSYLGWTYENSISRNITSPSVATNYSIIGYADALKRSSSGFQYMIDANTRGTWGGIWTANESYSFTSPLNTNTNITLNTKFGTWIYEDSGIEERMPWYSNKATGAAFITTNGIGSGSWWGTLITDASNWSTAPWIYNGMPTPNFIWYWVR